MSTSNENFPAWVQRRETMPGRNELGQLAGHRLEIEADDVDLEAWHVFDLDAGWDMWFDNAEDLLDWIGETRFTPNKT